MPAPAPDRAARFDAVRVKAANMGRVRVIAQLAVPFASESRLAAGDEVSAQRTAIASTREAVVRALPAPEGVKSYETMPYVALSASPEDLARLQASDLVVNIQEDRVSAPSTIEASMAPVAAPASPVFLDESTTLIGADAAWAQGKTGEGWAVAIIDTGVQTDHPFLAGKTVAEGCFSTNHGDDPFAEGASKSVCPNGGTIQLGPGAGANCDPDISYCDHGTYTAGIAVGENPSTGRPEAGVARGADLIAIQVFSEFTSYLNCGFFDVPCALTYDSDILAGLEYVHALSYVYDIASVNLSLGTGFSALCDDSIFKPIIDDLKAAGVAAVAATGNDGFVGETGNVACVSSAISVGSTQMRLGTRGTTDQMSSFSNFAPHVDLFAPGESIRSAAVGGGYRVAGGTSSSAPHVAGAWAILRENDPDASVDQILEQFQSTGATVTGIPGAPEQRYARIQIDAALQAAPERDNDDLVDAYEIDAIPFTGSASTTDASSEFGEFGAVCGGPDGGNSVWWSYTASTSGRIEGTTVGSDFDTILSVWTGFGLTESGFPLARVTCNDDAVGAQSAVAFNAIAGRTYFFRVSGVGAASGTAVLNVSDPNAGVRSVDSANDGAALLPTEFALAGIRPNPLRDRAHVAYALPETAHVRVVVYDVTGREVARLVDAERPAGVHAAPFDASGLASGVYLVRFEAGGVAQVERMTLVR